MVADYAAVSHVDEQIGRVMSTVRELGVRDNTLVVMHADHGYQLGEHNEWEKKTNYELAARVPLVISCPWLAASVGQKTHVLAELVDIFPTLVSLVGLEPLGEFDGRGTDLSPVFSDPARGAAFKNASYTQCVTLPAAPARAPCPARPACAPACACAHVAAAVIAGVPTTYRPCCAA